MPLLTTKLYIPPIRPKLVSRPRLIERMSTGMHRKLTLICAPAGFGKTTLLSECANRCGRPVAWLALDEADNDPNRFLSYLITALQSIEAELGKGILNTLQAPRVPPVASLLVSLINELVAVPEPFALVIDDYHVIEAEPIHEALAFLLDRQPPQMHLALSTRTDPPLPIARLRGRGQLTELRQNDLRFTLDETAKFLNEAMSLQLSTGDIETLTSRTEGWIAGLQMAAVSMQGRNDLADFVHAFAGSHRHVLDYLVEEVLNRQPIPIQTFLLQTAILDRLTAPLCDAVLGRGAEEQRGRNDPPSHVLTSSQEILEYLDRTNLFIVPLDEERRWYRYHHLFADLLRQRLQQTQPNSVRELHRRASAWCEQQGLMTAAIDYALFANDSLRAVQLVEQVAESAVMRSEIATLQGWLEALPDDLVRTRPILCVYHAWALLVNGFPLEVAEARLQDAVDADPDGTVAGEVLAVRALIAAYQRKAYQSAKLSRRALKLLPEERLFFRSFIAGSLGYNALYSGDLVAARQALEETVRISKRAGNLMNTVLALSHLGDVSVFEGHVHEGKAFYEQALTLAVDDQGRQQPIAGVALIGLGQLLILQHKLGDAERYLTEGIELINGWGKAGAIGGYLSLARIRKYQRDLDGAHKAIQTAERIAIQFDAMKADDKYVAREKARLWLVQGNIEAVWRWIDESGLDQEVSLHQQEQDGSETIPFNRALGYILVARTHMAQDRPDEALQVLRSLRQMVDAAGWTMYTIRILILESIALYLQDNVSEAMDPLARALALSEPGGFAGLYAQEGAPMAELLRHAASRGVAPQFVSYLLACFETESIAPSPSPHLPMPSRQVQPLVDPLTERELDVLHLLATPLSTAEIGDRLFISVSTVRSHTKNIYGKLNVHRRSEAAERARELNLIAN